LRRLARLNLPDLPNGRADIAQGRAGKPGVPRSPNMLLSIHDVLPYERHLLFCSQLDHDRRPRRHGHRDHHGRAINRSLPVCRARIAAADRVPQAIGCNF
jgi:hypothetical protein